MSKITRDAWSKVSECTGSVGDRVPSPGCGTSGMYLYGIGGFPGNCIVRSVMRRRPFRCAHLRPLAHKPNREAGGGPGTKSGLVISGSTDSVCADPAAEIRTLRMSATAMHRLFIVSLRFSVCPTHQFGLRISHNSKPWQSCIVKVLEPVSRSLTVSLIQQVCDLP